MPSVVATRKPRTNGLSRKKISELEQKRRAFVKSPNLDKAGSVKPSRAKRMPKCTHAPVTSFTSLEIIADLEVLFDEDLKRNEPLPMFAPPIGLPQGHVMKSSGRPSDSN